MKEFSPQDIEARQYSTLDLCPFDKFTLITSSSSQWEERSKRLQEYVENHGVQICTRIVGEAFDFVDQKHADIFTREVRLNTGGGLLVRPDQHILRVLHEDDGAEDLGAAILSHLGR